MYKGENTMNRTIYLLSILIGAIFLGSLLPLTTCMAGGCDCPNDLERNEQGTTSDGEIYKVRYHYLKSDGKPDFVDNNGNGKYDKNETCGKFFVPKEHAVHVKNAAVNTHNLFINNTYGFKAPNFSEKPNTVCVNDVNARGMACGNRIAVHDVNVREGNEPFTRGIVIHELFHQLQYAYIDKNEIGSWGNWFVEGTADYICDKLYWDIDKDPLATKADAYLPMAKQYIQSTEKSLIAEHSYDAALFWTYLTEQLGSHLPEPARGVDFLGRFMEKTDGKSPASIKYIRETIDKFSRRSTSFEEIFLDFCITNYTHNLDLSGLSGKYPDLDYPKRDYPARYTYYDESAAGGNTPYGTVKKTTIPDWDKEYNGSVKRWAAQYLEIDVTPLDLKGCEVIGLKGKADSGKELGWALIGMNAGKVLDMYRFTGNTFYSALLYDQIKKYDKLALVVAGMNSDSKFKYVFDSGEFTSKIMLPTQTLVARVGEKSNPQRFQIRFHLDGPKQLTPVGAGPPSVRGVDASKVKVTLVGKKKYTATVINSSYIDGDYRLVMQAPLITDPAEGDLFDLEVCLCSDGTGTCIVKASSPKSVIYGKFQKNQMIVLDRSGSMSWYGGVKFDAAKNAPRLAVDAGGESDRMGVVTFWGWRDTSRECEEEATKKSNLIQLGVNNRNVLINAIEGITIGGPEDGWTSIGDGLTLAGKQLFENRKLHKYDEDSILLLSDGLPNRKLYWEKDNSGCSGAPQVREQFTSNGSYADFKIYPEGFGPDADMGFLTRMAKETDGFAYSVRTDKRHCPLSDPLCMEIPNRLAESFRRIQEDFFNLDRLYYGVFDLVQSATPNIVEIPILVTEKSDGGVRDATFAFNWNDAASGVIVELWDPNGKKIDATTPDWEIVTPSSQSVRTNVVYHYNKVLPAGEWKVKFWAANKEDQILCILSGKPVRGVDISLHFSQTNDHGVDDEYRTCPPETGSPPYLRGLPVTIQVNLNDSEGGIAGIKDIKATIYSYEAESNQISLYDDGNHDDGLADDGIYGNVFTRTPFFATDKNVQDEDKEEPGSTAIQTGVYSVFVQVNGTNRAEEDFQRFISRDFHIFEYKMIPPCKDPDYGQR